ncbi:DUF2505 domain-containing protein [Flexivirga sp. ID2601S]|uniref:DUF2505 domain-containing protein n=1 Tax=Flexivirga aerilata TaxID=1656889 RepID=A0A849AH53_9MICO|nr:DUF2505 domain-containing protein [Flexivirga aerilata]NNG37760.1 DUF2505 domain-containing protein [Flexivirga aerilata]
MDISLNWTLKSDPDEVYDDAIKTEYQDDICQNAGALSYNSSVVEKGPGHQVTVQRVMPSGDVPDLLKKLVGDKVDVTQVITWGERQADGSRTGTVEVTMKGQPITMKGTTSIAPEGTGSRVGVKADLKAKLPLIGGKIEKMAAPEILNAIKAEEETSHQWDDRKHP